MAKRKEKVFSQYHLPSPEGVQLSEDILEQMALGSLNGDLQIDTGSIFTGARNADGSPVSEMDSDATTFSQLEKQFTAGQKLLKGDAVYLAVDAGSTTDTHSTDLEKGSSQYWSIIDGDQTGLDLSGDFTFEAWIKRESISASNGIMSKWGAAPERAYKVWVGNDGSPALTVSANGTGSIHLLTSDTPFTETGVWVHFAGAFDISAKTVYWYKNGALVSSSTNGAVPGAIFDGDNDFEIGASTNDSFLYDGLMDDVRIWSDLRTQTEINDNKGIELTGSEANLEGYWKFNNDGTDSTSNSNDLTNNGSATFSTDVAIVLQSKVTAQKTSATAAATSDGFVGFVKQDAEVDEPVTVIVQGTAPAVVSMTPGAVQFLSDTPGQLAESAGSVERKVGVAIDANTLSIFNTL